MIAKILKTINAPSIITQILYNYAAKIDATCTISRYTLGYLTTINIFPLLLLAYRPLPPY